MVDESEALLKAAVTNRACRVDVEADEEELALYPDEDAEVNEDDEWVAVIGVGAEDNDVDVPPEARAW